MIRATFPSSVAVLGDREVQITLSTSARARDGHILDPLGADLAAYRQNPIVLWQHNVNAPVGTNDNIARLSDRITARCTFAPEGASPTADQTCRLVKGGIIRGLSVGFDILEGMPIETGRPHAGLRVSKWALYECSFVSVPSDTGAVVTARSWDGRVHSPAEQELRALAWNDYGEVLTPAMIAQLTADARALGQTVAYRYQWLRAAGRIVSGDADKFADRQRQIRELARY